MLWKFGGVLLATLGLMLGGGAASAAPLAFYYNAAAWLAAVSAYPAYQIGPSPPAIVTETFGTVSGNDRGLTEVETTVSSSPGTVSSLYFDFTGAGNLWDLDCVGSVSYCSVTGTEADMAFSFSSPILGFAALNASFPVEDNMYLNGQFVPGSGPGFSSYNGFFGVVGLTSSLNFSCPVCAGSDDIPDRLSLDNILTVTVSEPSSCAIFSAACVLLMIVLIRGRKLVRPSAVRREGSPGTVSELL